MKFKVMVVDDEPIAAQATALMVQQSDWELEVVGRCHSGREAVNQSVLWAPDLVIMDIRMPGINGLDAMRHIKKRNPDTEFIILSAYGEFSYAVEALSLGASDYLLKPVTQETLQASVQKSLSHLRGKKNEMDQALQQREQLEIAMPMIRKDFIRALISTAGPDEQLVACATFLALTEQAGFVFALSSRGECPEDRLRHVCEYFRHKNEGLVYDIVSSTLAVAYVPIPEKALAALYMEEFFIQLERVLAQEKAKGNALMAGCSAAARGIAAMKHAARQAMDALAHMDRADPAIHVALCEKEGVSAVPSQEERSGGNVAGKMIQRAILFMQTHYARDLTLDEISAHINLSPFYFSRFFKELTGINFSEMLLKTRIDRAKELLTSTDASIKDIAFQVGFNDPNYFSKVFRKAAGIKASEYRAYHNQQGSG